jgi:hypothetical protein
MALLMVMTVCLLVYAALEYRIRPAGSSSTLSASICCVSLGREPSC